jgi:hypothetical protein
VAAKVRLTFLPVFLTLLAIAFSVALAFRIRAYRAMATAAPATSTLAPARDVTPSVGAPAPGRASWVLVEANAPAQSAPGGGRAHTAATTREQRFRQLLAMGNTPEAAAVKTAAEMPEQTVRPVSPPTLRNAAASAAPLKAAAPTAHSEAPQQRPVGSTPDDPHRRPEEPKDPNSDTTPPQLLGVEFQPPQIHDGEETSLIITAMDDLSGVRGISGTLTSPTGKALQGFAQQREGETNRYISRITIPKDAEEGTWKISFLNMSDQATNMMTLSYAQGTIPPNAVLKVISSRSDASPPTLRAVSVARRSMRSGETNTLFVEAEDDKSGVRLVSAVFVSPSKSARLGFGCKKGDGDTWECAMNVPDCLDCGDWQLEQVQMQDNANNYTTIRPENNPLIAAVRVNIAGNSCDSTPPLLQNLMLDKSIVIMGQGEPDVTIRVSVTDDTCGVGGLSGQVTGPGTNAGTFFAFSPEGGDSGTWVGRIHLTPQAPRGIWRIQSITANDKGQNLRIYYASDPLLARAQFLVK